MFQANFVKEIFHSCILFHGTFDDLKFMNYFQLSSSYISKVTKTLNISAIHEEGKKPIDEYMYVGIYIYIIQILNRLGY